MEFSLCTMGLQGLQVWVLILATNMYEQVPQGVAVTVDSIAVSSWKLLWETKNLNRLYLQHCYANDVARHANATAFAFDFAVVSVADRYRSLCCLYLGRLHILLRSPTSWIMSNWPSSSLNIVKDVYRGGWLMNVFVQITGLHYTIPIGLLDFLWSHVVYRSYC